MATINIKSLLGRLNNFCKTGLESAAGICVARSHYEITVEHVIWQLIESPISDFSLILKHFGITHEELSRRSKINSHSYLPVNGHLRLFSHSKNIEITCYYFSFCNVKTNESNHYLKPRM